MEPAQKQRIEENIDKLVDNTILNPTIYASLEKHQVLTKADLQRLRAKKQNEGDIAEAHLFYEIVKTRQNSYEHLIAALDNAKQGGASQYLKFKDNLENVEKAPESPLKHASSKMASAEEMIMGKDCEVGDVVDIVEKNPVGHAFLDKLSTLGRKLNVPSGKRKEIFESSAKTIDKFEQLLEEWMDNEGDNATLAVLLEAIDDCKSKSISDSIRAGLKVK